MLVNNNGKEKLTEQINKDKSQEKKAIMILQWEAENYGTGRRHLSKT